MQFSRILSTAFYSLFNHIVGPAHGGLCHGQELFRLRAHGKLETGRCPDALKTTITRCLDHLCG